MIFQITLAGYDGSTSETDDLIKWIDAPNHEALDLFVNEHSIILDSDFDRMNDSRNLLRMHELGHALGYNHVQSRVSIMNPKIGPGPTELDRAIARVAFKDAAPQESGCAIPVG